MVMCHKLCTDHYKIFLGLAQITTIVVLSQKNYDHSTSFNRFRLITSHTHFSNDQGLFEPYAHRLIQVFVAAS